MTALQPSLVPAEQDVRALVADICLALLGRHTQPANLPLHGPLPLHWTACVGIGGGWCGIVTVACPMELARRGASRILGVTPALVDDSAAQDLLAELANILGGNLKGIMASALGQPCHLALPVVAPGDPVFPGARRVRQLRFVCDEEVFEVSVLETATPQASPLWEAHPGGQTSRGGPGEREP